MSALVLALAVAASAASPKNEGHQAPVGVVEDKPSAGRTERQALLSELWQRRIVSPEMDRWAPEDLALLERVRAAENQGAVRELKRVYGGLKGWAAPQKGGALRLTKEGFEKWLFLRSQQALDYFAAREIDQKWAFQLSDLEDRKLFDPQGRLTPAGEALYLRLRANLPTQWKQPNGELGGNRRPGKFEAAKPKAPAGEDPNALPVTLGPEHPSVVDQIRSKYGRRYRPVLRGANVGKLTVVVEHDPDGDQDGLLLIVSKGKDKAAALGEFKKLLPTMRPPALSEVVTVEEKLAAMEKNLKHVNEHVGQKSYLALDSAAIEKELRKLLKGRLGVVWALAGPPPPDEPEAQPGPETAPPGTQPTAAPVSAGSGTSGPQTPPPAKAP